MPAIILRKNFYLRTVSFILLFLFIISVMYLPTYASSSTTSQIYYVSSFGNDTDNGYKLHPWKTLQHAADKLVAGDTVIVSPGQYTGFVMGYDNPQNGTADKPITFKALSGTIITQRNNKTPDGINLEGVSYIVIDGFEIDNMPRAGIRSVTNNHVIIRNNKTDRNNTWGIFTGFSDYLTIEGNETSRSKTQHGIYVSNSCKNPIVRRNKSWGNSGCGIHFNGDLSMGAPGLITGALIEGNIIYDNGKSGGSGINCDGVQNSVIQNNLLYNNHASGISLYDIDAAEGAKNNVIANNTILQPADSRWAINIQNGSTGNQVYNNILYDANHVHGSINVTQDSLSGFNSDYNIVVDKFTLNDGDSVLNLANWQKSTLQDKHSFYATPESLFVNVKVNDYRLSPKSRAIDSGTPKMAPTKDIEVVKRPRGKGNDIGAYEY